MQKTRTLTIAVLAVVVLAAIAAGLVGCDVNKSFFISSGVVIVTDSENNRVLIYTQPNRTNQPASVVLGQPNANSNTPNNGGLTDRRMFHPYGAAQGNSHELFVLDTFNCRVLLFRTPFVNGMAATTIIGQPDGATGDCTGSDSATAFTLRFPTGAAMDPDGNLWVADYGDSRVLKYAPPFSNGMAASLALGQTATNSASGTYECNQWSSGVSPFGMPPAPTASTLCYPSRVAFDSTGNLWVVDQGNYRVLMYPPAQQKQGGAATLVIGQADFVSAISGHTAAALGTPWDLGFDRFENLWVSDITNNRVLKYQAPFLNGMDASAALGQTDLVSNDFGTSASKLHYPYGLSFDNVGNLLVTDSANNRTLIFSQLEQETDGSATNALGQRDLVSGAANQGGAPGELTEYNPYGVLGFRL